MVIDNIAEPMGPYQTFTFINNRVMAVQHGLSRGVYRTERWIQIDQLETAENYPLSERPGKTLNISCRQSQQA